MQVHRRQACRHHAPGADALSRRMIGPPVGVLAEHLPELLGAVIRHALIGAVVEGPIAERVSALRPDELEPEPIDAEMIP